jgi:hypothetical protein
MKTRNIILSALCGLMTFGFVSCSKMLDIPQKGVLDYNTYYKTDDQILSADVAMYLEVRGWEYNVKLCKAMLTDDFWAGGSMRGDNNNLEHLNEFTFDAEEDYIQSMFTTYYTLIYKANVILGHVAEEGATAMAKQARAEAKVFRAFAYFDLKTMWGNPPLVDHELAPSEYNVPNGTDEALWALMEKDLTEAISSGALAEKSNVNDNATWRVTKQFAQALLGKVYLWQGKNKEAADQFDAVVTSGKYALMKDYSQIHRASNKHNCETLFESNRVHDDNNSFQNFSMYALMTNWRMDKMNWPADTPIMNTGWGFRVPTKSLYDDFVKDEGKDGYRLNESLKTLEQLKDELGITLKSPVIGEGYFMWKLRILAEERGMGNDFVYAANTIWMRYAEVLLCGAEAHLAAGNSAKATEYVNMIRERAHLAPKNGVTLDDIKLEKRLELFGEGTRMQDLLRWGEGSKMAANGTTYPELQVNGQVKNVSCNNPTHGFQPGKSERLPYPATEIRLNSEIKQNPGY